MAPEPQTAPWQEWVAGCRRGDRRCQRRLFDHFLPMVMGVAMRYTASYADACDVAQETFIKVFGKIHTLRDPDGFPAWLRRITARTAIDFLRTRRRFEPIDALPDHPVEPPPDASSHEAIAQCMAALPTGYRTVLNLYDIEGYSHREIAEMLGISENTSRSQLAKARKMMQQLLRRYGIE